MSEMVGVGLPLADCDIPLRPDGSVEHGGYFDDPVRMQLVLGADVSPWHEQAIMDACQEPADELGPVPVPEADRRALWVWSILTRQPMPAMGITLWLRPGPIQLPEVAWFLPLDVDGWCDGCVSDVAKRALVTHDRLQLDRTKGPSARIILVGRNHRVLGLTSAACHGLLASVWLHQVVDACCGEEQLGPQIEQFPAVMHHPVGQPHVMEHLELDRYLVAEGWRESAKQQRERHKRQLGRKRRGP
jgi:hypothetical protein